MKKKLRGTKKIHLKKPARASKQTPRSSRAPTPAKVAQPAQVPKPEPYAWRKEPRLKELDLIAMGRGGSWVTLIEAKNRISDDLQVLSNLVEQGSLVFPLQNADGTKGSCDPAASALCLVFELLKGDIAQFAKTGRQECLKTTWDAGLFFAKTIHELATDKQTARGLELHARRSLYLPSLQARQPTFTYDFKTVADTLHLSENCISNTSKNAIHRLGSPITNFVADIVESIGSIQEQLRAKRTAYKSIRSAYADPQSLAGLPKKVVDFIKRANADVGTEEQYLESNSFRPETLNYDSLPPLTKATADEWWDKAVSQEVSRRLNDHDPESVRLRQLVHYLKPYEQFADLRRRSKIALRSLARPTVKTPPPREG